MDLGNVNMMVPTFKVKGKQVVTPLNKQHSYPQIFVLKLLLKEKSIQMAQVDYQSFVTGTILYHWKRATNMRDYIKLTDAQAIRQLLNALAHNSAFCSTDIWFSPENGVGSDINGKT